MHFTLQRSSQRGPPRFEVFDRKRREPPPPLPPSWRWLMHLATLNRYLGARPAAGVGRGERMGPVLGRLLGALSRSPPSPYHKRLLSTCG